MLSIGFLLLAVFAVAYALVWLVYRYSEKHSVLDLPNERSSHTEPTATGGGLAIAVCVVFGGLGLWRAGLLQDELVLALLPALVMITITGWLDDHRHIRSLYRGFIYFFAAIWVTWVIGGIDPLNLGGHVVTTGVSGLLLAVLGTVWLTNLYNFMDGIDGLAAIEAITASAAVGVLLLYTNHSGEALLCLVLAGSAAAYLVWNWPPARIFMGDVGSCPLGFFFAVLAIWCHAAGGPSVYVWLILLGVFIADATYTLILRLLQGQKWYSAHRSHAYQKLVQMGYTHKQVTTAVLALNIVLLWPAAWFAFSHANQAVYLATGVYLLLGAIWGGIQHRSRQAVTDSH